MLKQPLRIALAGIQHRRTQRACRPATVAPIGGTAIGTRADGRAIRRVVIAAMTVLALSTLVTGNDAVASPVTASSYSMPNGDGKSIGGAYNYWDGNFTGTGNKTVDGAALSGGLGALTDGVIATQAWNHVSNVAGTGQDVGWFYGTTPDPTITFTFSAGTTINEVDVYLDNSGTGGVFAPSAILIDGTIEAFIPPPLGTVGKVVIGGLNLTGSSHTVQFDQSGPNNWVMVSEIAFAKSVPEPEVMTLLGLGIAGRDIRASSTQVIPPDTDTFRSV